MSSKGDQYRYRFHKVPLKKLLGARSLKRAGVDELIARYRAGDDELLTSLQSFSLPAVKTRLVEVSKDLAGQDPGRALRLSLAIEPILNESCLIAMTLAAQTASLFQLSRSRDAEETVKRAYSAGHGCEYCGALVGRVDAQRLMADNRLEEAAEVLRAAQAIASFDIVEKGKTLLLHGQLHEIGYSRGNPSFSIERSLRDLLDAREIIKSSKRVPARFVRAVENSLLHAQMHSGRPLDLDEAYESVQKLKRLGYVGAEAAKLSWSHGLLIMAVKDDRKRAKRYIAAAIKGLEGLGMTYDVAGAKADLATLHYPKREPIIELFKHWRNAQLPNLLESAMIAFWAVATGPLLDDSDTSGDLWGALQRLRAVAGEQAHIPPFVLPLESNGGGGPPLVPIAGF